MINSLANWIEARTGLRTGWDRLVNLPIPGGARWVYTVAAALVAAFLIEAVTGILLATTYSPSASTAWGSVYYITYRMELGWFIRGMHRFGGFALVVLVGAQLLVTVVTGAYRAPREIQWWILLGLVFLTLVLGVTGNILPWDQRGYWAAVVEMNIAGGSPGIGPILRKIIVGGSEFGNQTVTRIYGLHALVLPGLYLLGLAAWAGLTLRQGVHRPARIVSDEPYWPKQAFLNKVAALAVLAIVSAVVIARHGYSLDAPADTASQDYPARPEWYFLSLNRLLHRFTGDKEIIGTMVIPGAIGLVFTLLPFFDRLLPRRLAHFMACGVVFAVAGGAGFLTMEAWDNDARDVEFRAARDHADQERDRARLLADHQGIPPEGASALLSLDPMTRGADLFARKCQGCHPFAGKVNGEQSAAELSRFGSRAWVRGLLEKPDADSYFGKVPNCDGMQSWKKSSELKGPELDVVADFVATFAAIPPDVTPAEWLAEPSVKGHPGFEPFQNECASCHSMGDPAQREAATQPAPDLFAYGSDRWISRMIRHPDAVNLYGYLGKKQRMPAAEGQITEADLRTLIRYLKGDAFMPKVTSTSH